MLANDFQLEATATDRVGKCNTKLDQGILFFFLFHQNGNEKNKRNEKKMLASFTLFVRIEKKSRFDHSFFCEIVVVQMPHSTRFVTHFFDCLR